MKNSAYAVLLPPALQFLLKFNRPPPHPRTALLPTLDPVTLMLEMLPLTALYEVGILLARTLEPATAVASGAGSRR